MERILKYFEQQAFGVCARLGDYIGVPISRIRLFFIYSTFLTAGSPILVYLSLAFLMNLRRYLRQRRYSIWS
jgi:phage shock protein C